MEDLGFMGYHHFSRPISREETVHGKSICVFGHGSVACTKLEVKAADWLIRGACSSALPTKCGVMYK